MCLPLIWPTQGSDTTDPSDKMNTRSSGTPPEPPLPFLLTKLNVCWENKELNTTDGSKFCMSYDNIYGYYIIYGYDIIYGYYIDL